MPAIVFPSPSPTQLREPIQYHLKPREVVTTSLLSPIPDKRLTETIPKPVYGRRKGDAILVAINYAIQRGDLAVTDQLMFEYQRITGQLVMGAEPRARVSCAPVNDVTAPVRRAGHAF